jgi:hypothetical protein
MCSLRRVVGGNVMFELLKLIGTRIFDTALEFWRRHLDERRHVPTRFLKMKGLTDEIRRFDPFLSSRDDQTQGAAFWTRNEDLRRFDSYIETPPTVGTDYANVSLIVAGPSGAGKTIFLTRVVRPQYPERFVLISEYSDFFSTLINKIPCPTNELIDARTYLAGDFDAFARNAKAISIGQILDNSESLLKEDSHLSELSERTNEFVRTALEGRETTLFVFDQIERFLVDVRFGLTHTSTTLADFFE